VPELCHVALRVSRELLLACHRNSAGTTPLKYRCAAGDVSRDTLRGRIGSTELLHGRAGSLRQVGRFAAGQIGADGANVNSRVHATPACGHLLHKAGFKKTNAQTGAVTLIQRFGSALNLNIHFHMLYLDGVYIEDQYGTSRFRRVNAPSSDELLRLTHTIAHRVGRYLERRGLLERHAGNTYNPELT
jgi:hypothetical protein